MHTSGDHHHHDHRRPRPRTHHRRRLGATVLALGLGLGALATGHPAGAVTTSEVTARVSVTSAGAQLTASVETRTAVDETGRHVAFSGSGRYGPTGDTNGKSDVFVRDRLAGLTTRVSVTDTGAQLAGESALCGASSDLQHIGFWSNATNLPGGGTGQIYVRDREVGTTHLVSIGAGGLPSLKPGGGSGIQKGSRCDISADGRYVVFASEGNNFVADGNGVSDVFRRDLTTGTTIRVSVRDDENEIPDGPSSDPQISDSGALVAFASGGAVSASDGNGKNDVFLRHVTNQTTVAVSLRPNGTYPDGRSSEPAISGDGSLVAFVSTATDLNANEPDENDDGADVYVRPTAGGATTRVSVSATEAQGDHDSYAPSLSRTGRYVAFTSLASNLWPIEGNTGPDAFVRDRQLGLTSLASRKAEGLATSGTTTSSPPVISADGTAVAFTSQAPDLVRKDTNGGADAFVRDVDVDHAPFDSFDALVAQQFADFVGRAPTSAEATEWRARLAHGELSPDEVIADLAHSPAWAQRRGPVTRLYWSFFLRAPDQAGLDYWVAQNAAGKGLHTIAGQFAQTKEFRDMYGSLGSSAFVTLVYQNVLERDPDLAGLHYWTGQLDGGAISRGSLMVGFSESAEGRAFLAPQVDVVLVHLGMFRKLPSKATFSGYAAWLDGGVPLEEVVLELRHADAYGDRLA